MCNFRKYEQFKCSICMIACSKAPMTHCIPKYGMLFHSNSMERLVEDLSQQSGVIIDIKDHLGHTLLHEAVEKKDRAFVECLIAVGCNPNVKEDCGVTPLTIAVLLHDKDTCQRLVSCGASIKGPLFVNVPSPLAVAEKLELTEICEIMQLDSSDDGDEVISSYDTSFRIFYCRVDKRKDKKEINRTYDGYITCVVGDVGT